MASHKEIITLMEQWWDELNPVRQNNGLPAKGTVAGALVVLERLKVEYVLDIDHHRTGGKSQIKGVSKTATQKILESFSEVREFLQEGGRTNRGLAGDIAKLLDTLKLMKLHNLQTEKRNQLLRELQIFLVGKVGDYFNRERVKFVFNPELTTWQSIHEILEQSRSVGKEGPVAQYLIGAKLELRFPNLSIRNDSYSTSDVQSGSPGDFLINDTAFHITVAPNQGHYDKCKANVEKGYRVCLLVPDRIMIGARQNADNQLCGRITVQSIESFVSQNIEELSSFAKGELIHGFRQLLDIYNQRVDQVEHDKSMLIEIPRNMSKLVKP